MSMLTKIKDCANCKNAFIWKRGMSFAKLNCSPKCHSEWVSKNRLGKDNPNWKGDEVISSSMHCWVRDNFKKNGVCEHCGKIGRTDWSNLTHKYRKIREEWQELCRGCHQRYDYKMGYRKPYHATKNTSST